MKLILLVAVLVSTLVVAFPELSSKIAQATISIAMLLVITSLIDDDSVKQFNELIMKGIESLHNLK